LIATFFIIVALRIFTEYSKDRLVIKQFEVPQGLIKMGYNGTVIAQMLLEEIKKSKAKVVT